MKILITGGAGFIGTYTKELLKKEGHDVFLLDNLSTGDAKNIDEDDVFYKADVQNLDVLEDLDPIDTIIHLAAQIQVPVSMSNPLFDMQQNIEGTIKVVEFAKKANVKKVIIASTAAVYGAIDQLPIQEDSSLHPMAPYGISKMAAEKYVETLCTSYGIDYVVLRYANVFGPKQSAKGEGGVIKIFYDVLSEGSDPKIEGDGNQTRDFIYVEDIAQAHLFALHSPNGTYNISTNTEITINELCSYMNVSMGKRATPTHVKARQGDIYRSCLDNAKFMKATGWKPQFSVKAGINKMISELKQRG